MNWKGWLAVALIVFLIIKAPHEMAHLTTNIWNGLSAAVTGIGTFLGDL